MIIIQIEIPLISDMLTFASNRNLVYPEFESYDHLHNSLADYAMSEINFIVVLYIYVVYIWHKQYEFLGP
jgi:hypothetical protein